MPPSFPVGATGVTWHLPHVRRVALDLPRCRGRIAAVERPRGLASRPACPTLPLTVARPEGATETDDESERGDMTALRVCLPPVTPMEEQHG
ncbi:hypothetical protein GCM10010531_43470 [Blastococcus jejuensis]|uniref:Uncharacterized protein n=1 Tax=Blastococcus jejuensis TaxID=351224 RepID=A0ABP6PP24_9ACTN